MMNIRISGNILEVDTEGKHAAKHNFIETLRRLDLGPVQSYSDILQEYITPALIGMKFKDIDKSSILKTLMETMGDEEE